MLWFQYPLQNSFCLCPENLNEDELKNNALICLAEKISRLSGLCAVAWLFLIALSWICNESDQEVEGNGMKNVQFNKKRRVTPVKVGDKAGVVIVPGSTKKTRTARKMP